MQLERTRHGDALEGNLEGAFRYHTVRSGQHASGERHGTGSARTIPCTPMSLLFCGASESQKFQPWNEITTMFEKAVFDTVVSGSMARLICAPGGGGAIAAAPTDDVLGGAQLPLAVNDAYSRCERQAPSAPGAQTVIGGATSAIDGSPTAREVEPARCVEDDACPMMMMML